MKHTSVVLLTVFLMFFAVSCATFYEETAEEEIIYDITEIPVFTNTAEAVVEVALEEPVVTAPAAVEKSVAKPAEETSSEIEDKDFTYSYIYEFAGYEIGVEVHNGYGYVSYPSFITDSELSDALSAFVEAHGDFGVKYEKVEPGKLAVYYAKNLAKSDFDYIAGIASSDLTWYLNNMFTSDTTVTETTEAKQPETADSNEPEDFQYSYVYKFSYYEAEIEIHNGYGYVYYPSFITDTEIADALATFVKAHGDFGVKYEKLEAGKLALYYAKDIRKADFDYIANIASDDLTWYLNRMFAINETVSLEIKAEEPVKSEETKTEEPAVAEQKTEEVVVTVEAPQAQAQTETKTEIQKPAETTPVTEVATSDVSKQNIDVKKIVLISVISVLCIVAIYFIFRKKK